MSFNVMILYPSRDDARFDMKYYLEQHMPLIERSWRPYGLLSWKIIEFGARGDAQKPPHSVANLLTWEDEESYNTASKAVSMSAVCGDISNFSNQKPIMITGKTVDMG